MQRRSATTGSIMEALCAIQETVGVLSDPERSAAMHASGNVSRRVYLWRTRATISRSEFVIIP